MSPIIAVFGIIWTLLDKTGLSATTLKNKKKPDVDGPMILDINDPSISNANAPMIPDADGPVIR